MRAIKCLRKGSRWQSTVSFKQKNRSSQVDTANYSHKAHSQCVLQSSQERLRQAGWAGTVIPVLQGGHTGAEESGYWTEAM